MFLLASVILFTGGGVSLTETPRADPLDRDIPPCTVKSGRYASYWNAFLFSKIIFNFQMMRLRVGAQSFTVVTLLMGVAYSARERRLERAARKAEHEALVALVPGTK